MGRDALDLKNGTGGLVTGGEGSLLPQTHGGEAEA